MQLPASQDVSARASYRGRTLLVASARRRYGQYRCHRLADLAHTLGFEENVQRILQVLFEIRNNKKTASNCEAVFLMVIILPESSEDQLRLSLTGHRNRGKLH